MDLNCSAVCFLFALRARALYSVARTVVFVLTICRREQASERVEQLDDIVIDEFVRRFIRCCRRHRRRRHM